MIRTEVLQLTIGLVCAALVAFSASVGVAASANDCSVKRVFRPARDVRTDENIQPIQPIDDASWIWADAPARWGVSCLGRRDADVRNLIPPEFYRFRRAFTATAERLTIDVSADERFVLLLDGRLIARGPHRGMVEHWFYQTYELALSPGEHVLEAVCWQIGGHAPLAQMSWRGGFVLKASGSYDGKLTTGKAAWQVARIDGTSFTGQGKSDAWGVGSESRIEGSSFLHRIPPPADYRPAVIVRSRIEADEYGLRRPGWLLFPTALPDLLEVRRRPGEFKAARDDLDDSAFCAADAAHPMVARMNALLRQGRRLVVPPRTEMRAVWDLGDYYCAYPELKVSGGKGSEIRWAWVESLRDATGHKADRAAFVGKSVGPSFGDVFRPDGRAAGVFTSPWWRCGRWCQLEICTGDAPLELQGLALDETRYPLEDEGSFECDDPTVGDIRRICTRALQMCFHDMSFDCPYFEQHMYPGDSRNQYLSASALSADGRLAQQAMTLFGEAQRPNGLVPMNFPGRMTQETALYTLCWTFMFRDWLRWHGETTWMMGRLPGVRHAIDGLAAFETVDGLLGPTPGWMFSDYTNPWHEGVAPRGKDGLSAVENLFYLYALQGLEEIERTFGERHLAAHYAEKAARLSAAVRRRFWSDARGVLSDTVEHDSFSEQALAMSVLTGLLSESEKDAAMRLVEAAPKDLTPATVYFNHYLFEAFFACGWSDLFFRRLDLWRSYVRLHMSTLQESPMETDGSDPRSDCHAWGAHPLYHLAVHVAGIQPVLHGFKRVRVAPQPGPLKFVRASMPTPGGTVSVDLKFDLPRVSGQVTLPPGIAGEFVWRNKRIELRDGVNCIENLMEAAL